MKTSRNASLVAALVCLPLADATRSSPVNISGTLRYPLRAQMQNESRMAVYYRNFLPLKPQKNGLFYTIEVEFGTPAQTVTLNVDTGSSETWVNPFCSRSLDPKLCRSFGRFYSDESDSYRDLQSHARIDYGVGFAELDFGSDRIRIGSAEIAHQVFGIAKDSGDIASGIFGAAPSRHGWDSAYPSKHRFNNIWGPGHQKFCGNLEVRPIIPASKSPDRETRYWIYLNGMIIEDMQTSLTKRIFQSTNGQPVLVDSGNSFSALPQAIFSKVLAEMPGATRFDSELYHVPCSYMESDLAVGFQFGSTVIQVPYKDLIRYDPEEEVCILGLLADDELKGLVLALQTALDVYETGITTGKFAIFTDNQAAIQAIRNPKHPSGQYILTEVIQTLDNLRNQGGGAVPMDPGTRRSARNEAADKAAKEAAGHDPNRQTITEPLPEPTSLRVLNATTKSIIRKTMMEEWKQTWETAKHGRELFRLGVRPGKDVLKIHADTRRAISSMITQLRTGKIGLRQACN
ncbi:hypothetical protein ACCO45_009914 [Purpureocillium lilacinum]|uniref:Uncharacterized protein n=1 Tax=Purpureocillium lilacinum TaxID=33203 RepID=A0ACC4DDL4_PURLI